MCEREREQRREGESKGDRVHERQVGGGVGALGGMQRRIKRRQL